MLGSFEPFVHLLLHAPDSCWLIERLSHEAHGLDQVAHSETAIEVLADDITQDVPTITTLDGDRKHGRSIGFMNVMTPGTHFHSAFFRTTLRAIHPDTTDCTRVGRLQYDVPLMS